MGVSSKNCEKPTWLEREIDELVYALYGLTKDEIKLVEEGTQH